MNHPLRQTLIVERRKPRNPLVAPSMRRKAGAHRASESAARQRAQRAVRAALRELHSP
jgi:hypothetical protein